MVSFGCPLKDAYGQDFKKKKQRQVVDTPQNIPDPISKPVPFDVNLEFECSSDIRT